VDWEEFLIDPLDFKRLDSGPQDGARFSALEEAITEKGSLSDLKSDLADWIYRDAPMMVKANKALDVYGGPDESLETFRQRSVAAADDKLQDEEDKLEEKYQRKLDNLATKLKREQRELAEDEADVSRRKQEEYTSYAETIFSFFSGRRRSLSTAMSKRGRRSKAEEEVEESIEEIADLKEQIADLKLELEDEIDELETHWMEVAEEHGEIPVTPYKKDIHLDFFGIAWLPYYLIQIDDRPIEIPAYDVA
jgi:hypothetical protein